jgi:hypothetical protein
VRTIVAKLARLLRTLNGERWFRGKITVPTQDLPEIEEPESIYARPVDGSSL